MQAAVDAVALITRRGQAAHSKAYGMQDREWVILPRRVQTARPVHKCYSTPGVIRNPAAVFSRYSV